MDLVFGGSPYAEECARLDARFSFLTTVGCSLTYVVVRVGLSMPLWDHPMAMEAAVSSAS